MIFGYKTKNLPILTNSRITQDRHTVLRYHVQDSRKITQKRYRTLQNEIRDYPTLIMHALTASQGPFLQQNYS